MNLEDTLLYGIQKVPGDTAGEKFKYINILAKEIAINKNNSEEFPEQLKPLLNVEVAKIVNNTDLIVQALRTSDALLCHRALQILDLFPDENCPLLQWNYFNSELLSKVSFTTRHKLIKKVAQDLQKKDFKYAENFYLEVSKLYGQKQAIPLVLACSENFLHEQVTKNQIELPIFYVRKLFRKYPNFIISYLDQHIKILPSLLEEHFDILVEFCNSYKFRLSFRLGKRRTKTFLSKGTQLLIEKPHIYLRVLCLKTVAYHLSEEKFTLMMSKLLPKDVNKFCYHKLSSKFIHFSDEKKLQLTIATFNKAYGKNLYDYPELITPKLLIIIPYNDRYPIARMKLKNDKHWNFSSLDSSWRVYLPLTEIFDEVRRQIAKNSDEDYRVNLTKLLIYNCKINNDKDGLLEVLKYISKKHINQRFRVLEKCLHFIRSHFDLAEFDLTYWDIIMKILKRMIILVNEKYDLDSCCIKEFLKSSIQFKFANNLNLDDDMIQLMNAKFSRMDEEYYSHSGIYSIKKLIICPKNFKLQKIFFEKFMDLMEAYYTKDDMIEAAICVDDLLYGIMCYNSEAKLNQAKGKEGEEGVTMINIEDYPRFIQFIESTALSVLIEGRSDFNLMAFTKEFNLNLFKKWFPKEEIEDTEDTEEEPIIYNVGMNEIRILKKNHREILDKWEKYQKAAVRDLDNNKYQHKVTIFLRSLRWYNELPIKFVNASFSQLKNPRTFDAVKILGIMLGGDKYEELIDPLIPSTPKLDVERIEKREIELQITKCLLGMNFANPPPSLALFERLFNSEFLPLCKRSLFSIVCRLPVPTVTKFVSDFINEKVGVTNKMITVLFTTAATEDILRTFEKVLKFKPHPSIHVALLNKLWKMFKKEPSEFTYNILQKCVAKRPIEDEEILSQLTSLKSLPAKECVASYIEKMLPFFEKVQIEDCPNLSNELVRSLLKQLDGRFAGILPDKFQKELVEKYLFNRIFDDENPSLELEFLFEVYLSSGNVDEKMIFVSGLFTKFIGEYFGKRVKDKDGHYEFYRANEYFKKVVSRFVKCSGNKQVNLVIVNCLLGLFDSIIKPWQDVQSFLFLSWIKEFNKELSIKEFGVIFGQKMHVWIHMFGSDYVNHITEFAKMFLRETYGSHSDNLYLFVEGLLEVKNNHSYVCAGLLLSYLDRADERYTNVVEELKTIDLFSVRALIYEMIYSEKFKCEKKN